MQSTILIAICIFKTAKQTTIKSGDYKNSHTENNGGFKYGTPTYSTAYTNYPTSYMYCPCFILSSTRCALNLVTILRRLKPLATPRSFRSLSVRCISRLPSTSFSLKSSARSASLIPLRNSDMSLIVSFLAISSRCGLSAGTFSLKSSASLLAVSVLAS